MPGDKLPDASLPLNQRSPSNLSQTKELIEAFTMSPTSHLCSSLSTRLASFRMTMMKKTPREVESVILLTMKSGETKMMTRTSKTVCD